MGLAQVIEEIEAELAIHYLPGAMQYIDKHYSNSWSRAIDRLQLAMMEAGQNKETYWKVMEIEGQIYKQTILKYIEIYKVFKRGNKTDDFFKELETGVPSVQENGDDSSASDRTCSAEDGPIQAHLQLMSSARSAFGNGGRIS